MKDYKMGREFKEKLESRGITRRDFLKICGTLATMMGVSQASVPKIAGAIEKTAKKPSVVWTAFAACTGCSESLLKAYQPGIAKIVLDIISLDYHNTINAASGEQNISLLNDLIKKGDYIWLAEGAVPEEDGFCEIGDKQCKDWATELAKNAQAIVAVGTCSSAGGIPGARPNPGKVKSIAEATGATVINLTGCPPNPDWMISTLVYWLTYKKLPPLDSKNRPLFIYGQTVHDICPRRGMFEEGNFVPYPGAPEEAKEFCLYKVGCKGPAAPANCPQVLWNHKTNWCNGGGQCIGCTDANFPDAETPFYGMLPGVAIPGFAGTTVTADKLGLVAGAAAVVGIGVHAAAGAVAGKNKKAEK